MSGLFGIFNRNGAPVERAVLEAMAQSIAHRGGDLLEFSIQRGAGFGCHLRRVVPESINERQPLLDDSGNLLLFDGRIDNREDLLEALDLRDAASELSDSDLVLRAFGRWGGRCLDRLVGDFALALFRIPRRQLILARDPIGCRPLYFREHGPGVVFASEIKAILACPGIDPEPNLDLLADLLLLDHLPWEDDGETFFRGISRVLPGWRLKFQPEKTGARRFWDFNAGTRLRYSAYSDYATHLREVVISATRKRMRSIHPVAIAVSGGLDSSIVLGVADQLQKKYSGPDIVPISYAPSDPHTEENRFLALMEERTGREIVRVGMGRPGDSDHLRAAAWYSEMPIFDDGWSGEAPMLSCAAAGGARVVMTGLWSDQLMFATGYLVDLVKRLEWRRVRRHLNEYTRWFVASEPAYFRRRFARELMLNLVPNFVRSSIRPFYGAASLLLSSNHRWVNGELSRRARRLRPRVRHPSYASAQARSIYQTARSKSHRLAIEGDEKMAARFGLERVTPFLDRDVIASVMAIPGEILTRRGVPRGLLRDAFRGIVPPPILERRWKDEGTVSSVLEGQRVRAYRALRPDAFRCKALGCDPSGPLSDDEYLDALALEFWMRAFLTRPSESVNPTRETHTEAI